MAEEFIQVVEKEGEEMMEFPLEEDGTLLLKTIQTQFANAIGIKYRGPSGAWRAIRESDDARLIAPKAGWGEITYCLTFSQLKDTTTRKRKVEGDTATEEGESKYPRSNPLLKDLAVIGVPYEADHRELKQFLNEKYGGVAQLMLKTDQSTGKSRGFGFIRFDNEESAKNALAGELEYMGRKIYIKPKTQKPIKMYVNSLAEGTTKEDLVDYFSQFGEVVDSYIPVPFKSYGFFTFASADDGHTCMRQESHTINGRSIVVKLRQQPGEGGGASFDGRGGHIGGGRGGFNNARGGSFNGRGGGGGRGGFNNVRGGGGAVGYSPRGGGRGGGYAAGIGMVPAGMVPGPSAGMGPGMVVAQPIAGDLKNMLYQFLSENPQVGR